MTLRGVARRFALSKSRSPCSVWMVSRPLGWTGTGASPLAQQKCQNFFQTGDAHSGHIVPGSGCRNYISGFYLNHLNFLLVKFFDTS